MSVKFLAKTTGAVAVCAAIYAAAGYWGVPEVVRWAAENYLKPALGAKSLTIENVAFNPWTWELEINGVKAMSTSDKPLLTLTKFYTDVSSASVTNGAPVITKLTVDGLKAAISTASQKAQAATSAAQQSTTSSKAAESSFALPAFSISDIAITNSAVTLTNPKAGVSVAVTDITVALPLVSTLATGSMAPVTPQISLKIDGKPVNAKGTATMSSANLHLSVANLDVAKIIKAAGVTLPVRVEKASLSTDTDIAFEMKGSSAEVTMKGTVAAGAADIRETNGQPLATLAGAEVKITNFDLAKKTVAIESVAVSSPNMTVRRTAPASATTTSKTASGTTSKAASSATSGAAAGKSTASSNNASETKSASPAASVSGDWKWSVASARVTNGSINVIDGTVSPAATLKATAVNVTAKNLTSEKNKTGTLTASARIADGQIKADGTLGVNPVQTALKTTVTSVAFAPFNGWVKPIAGAQFSSGSADVNGNFKYADGKTPTVTFAGDLSISNLGAKSAKGETLMTWKKATATGLNLKSVDPVALSLTELVIEQPAQKVTKTVSKVANLFGALAAATGRSNLAEKAAKVEREAQRDIKVKGLKYENGSFAVSGYSTDALGQLAVTALNNVFAQK